MDIRHMSREEASEVRQSKVWEMVCKEIDFRIYCLTERLKKCKVSEFEVLQAEVLSWESFKRLPDEVADRESDWGSETP